LKASRTICSGIEDSWKNRIAKPVLRLRVDLKTQNAFISMTITKGTSNYIVQK
jgi:hypothetical protein